MLIKERSILYLEGFVFKRPVTLTTHTIYLINTIKQITTENFIIIVSTACSLFLFTIRRISCFVENNKFFIRTFF